MNYIRPNSGAARIDRRVRADDFDRIPARKAFVEEICGLSGDRGRWFDACG